ncbi:hypothetical protein DPX16_22963 [Anabarilius grahami]|uniref:Uncharacterized protein n=1 Tax=Anabarilius grahami TaxID=495550 RepID=A0A3N0Y6Z9_ANAGA|nr:hypothetical protein DPX16_22963 [Anabarilius grahami]
MNVRTPTLNQNRTRQECLNLNTTLRTYTKYADEREHGKAARSHKDKTIHQCQGSVKNNYNKPD